MKSTETLTTIFREQGLRVTPQRQAIFRLLEGDDSHPTVESLFDRARVDMPTISLKTVYQTLHDLADLGEVALLDVGTGATRVDPNIHEGHHHLVCERCGKVRDLTLEFAGLEVPADARQGFAVRRAEIVFRGRCGECADDDTVPTITHQH